MSKLGGHVVLKVLLPRFVIDGVRIREGGYLHFQKTYNSKDMGGWEDGLYNIHGSKDWFPESYIQRLIDNKWVEVSTMKKMYGD